MLEILFILLLTSGTEGFFKFYDEGKSASLECTADRGEVQYWFLHGNGNAIGYNSVEDDVFLNHNGSLHFRNVSKDDHEGKHVCVVKYEEVLEAHWVEMEVKPLPPTNLWEYQYKRMFVTAVISALLCLVLLAGFCLIKEYRWSKRHTRVPESNVQKASYINPALEDIEENCRM